MDSKYKKKPVTPHFCGMSGSASGVWLNYTINSCPSERKDFPFLKSITKLFLQTGQNTGNLTATVSGLIFVRVLLWQIGQYTQLSFTILSLLYIILSNING